MQRSWADIEDTPPDNSQEHHFAATPNDPTPPPGLRQEHHFAATPNSFDPTPPPTQAEAHTGLTQPLAEAGLGAAAGQPPPAPTAEEEDAGRLDGWLEELRQSGRLAPGGSAPQPPCAAPPFADGGGAAAGWSPHGLGPHAHAAGAATPKRTRRDPSTPNSRKKRRPPQRQQEQPRPPPRAEQQPRRQAQPQAQPQAQRQAPQQQQQRQHQQHRHHQGPHQQQQQQQEPQCLNESEAEWANRLVKRMKGVSAIKNTPEYAQAQLVRGADPDFPLTPDPEDRSVSKRQWEASVQEWRRVLRRRAGVAEEA